MELILHSASDIFKTAQVELGVARARPKPMAAGPKPMGPADDTPAKQRTIPVTQPDGSVVEMNVPNNWSEEDVARAQEGVPAAATDETSEAVPPVEQPVEQAGAGLSGVTPEIDQAEDQAEAEVADAAAQTGARISQAQFAKMLHNPQIAEQALEMYRSSHPEFATKLENTLKKYQYLSNPQPAAGEGTTPELNAGAGGAQEQFAAPSYLRPEQQQHIQQTTQYRNWANKMKQQGWSDADLQQYAPQMQMPQQGYPQQGQPQQQYGAPGTGVMPALGRAWQTGKDLFTGKGFQEGQNFVNQQRPRQQWAASDRKIVTATVIASRQLTPYSGSALFLMNS